MQRFHVRTVEERLADPGWARPKSWLLLLPVLSLGTLSFVWFWLRSHLDGDERSGLELWAWIWGAVAVISSAVGGGLVFATPDQIALSGVVWLLRATSLMHVWSTNRRRLERIARREFGIEAAMVAGVQSSARRSPTDPGALAPRFPTSTLPTVGPGYGYADAELQGAPHPAEYPLGVPAPQAPEPETRWPAGRTPAVPPVSPTSAGRVLEPPPVADPAPWTSGGLPPELVPDVEPDPVRWIPGTREDPAGRRADRGRRLDL